MRDYLNRLIERWRNRGKPYVKIAIRNSGGAFDDFVWEGIPTNIHVEMMEGQIETLDDVVFPKPPKRRITIEIK